MASGWSLARSAYKTDTYGSPHRVVGLDQKPWSLQDEMTEEEQHLFANLGYLLASNPRATAGSSDAPTTPAEQTANRSAAGKPRSTGPPRWPRRSPAS